MDQVVAWSVKSVLFEKKSYLLPICRYVATSPQRSLHPVNYSVYKWSSYRALAGQVRKPAFLHQIDVLNGFAKREKDAQRKYREYVKNGLDEESPLAARKNQVLLGSPKFLNEMQPILEMQPIPVMLVLMMELQQKRQLLAQKNWPLLKIRN